MPAENRVWCDDRRHLLEQTTPQSVPQFAEATPLVVLETQAPSAEPGLQNSILFSQKRDQICLLTMKPRTYRHDEQLKRSHARSLGNRVDPVVGHHGSLVSELQVAMVMDGWLAIGESWTGFPKRWLAIEVHTMRKLRSVKSQEESCELPVVLCSGRATAVDHVSQQCNWTSREIA